MAKCTCGPKRRSRRDGGRTTAYGDPYQEIRHVDTEYEMVDAARGAFGNDIYVFKNDTGDRIELTRIRSRTTAPQWRLAVNGDVVKPTCAKTEMLRTHRWTLQLFEMIDEGLPFTTLPH